MSAPRPGRARRQPGESSVYVHVRFPDQPRAVRSPDGTVYLHLGSNVTCSLTAEQFDELVSSAGPRPQ